MQECAQCKQPFEADELNASEHGEICDGCRAGADQNVESLVALARAKSMAIAGAVSAALGTLISIRSTSTEGVILESGDRFQSVMVSADIPGLVGCGLATVFLAYGIYLVLTIEADPKAAESIRSTQLKLGAALLMVLAWSIYRFAGSLPYVAT